MKFVLSGELHFEADDLDDAFQWLAEYFNALQYQYDNDIDPTPRAGTNIKLKGEDAEHWRQGEGAP